MHFTAEENIIPGPPQRALLLPATFTASLGLFYMACRQILKDATRGHLMPDAKQVHISQTQSSHVWSGCANRLYKPLEAGATFSQHPLLKGITIRYYKKGILFQNSLKVTCQIQFVNRSSSLIFGPIGKNLL